MKFYNTLVVLDLETTGTWIEKDKVVEIAMVKYEPDGKKEVYLHRCNPGIPIPPVVSELIGIYDKDVDQEPFFKERAKEILDFIGDADLAGFNLERFDLPLLEREMYEAGLKFEWQRHGIYDAQKVYHLKERRDLAAAYQFYCDKKLENAHTALADAEATYEILVSQVDQYGEGRGELSVLNEFQYRITQDFYDPDRRFRWWNGELYPMFGKYAKRYSLQQLALKDPSYLRWMSGADFNTKVKELAENALKGVFPEPIERGERSERS